MDNKRETEWRKRPEQLKREDEVRTSAANILIRERDAAIRELGRGSE
jgi:hypothetical protein